VTPVPPHRPAKAFLIQPRNAVLVLLAQVYFLDPRLEAESRLVKRYKIAADTLAEGGVRK
jgi:hypothetical protein